MKKNFNEKNATSIKFITEKIKRDKNKSNPQTKKQKRKMKKTYESGKLSTSNRKNISIGLHILERIIYEGFDMQERQLLLGKQDISKIHKEIVTYRTLMEDFIQRLSISAEDEYELQKRIESLSDYSKIVQAARDGILIKQEKRIEVIDGKEKEIIYDTSITPGEVLHTLIDYEEQFDDLTFNKLNNYLGVGLGLAGTIGALVNEDKKNNQEKGFNSLVSLGTIVFGGAKLLRGVLKQDDKQTKCELSNQEFRMIDDLLKNEQISSEAETTSILNIKLLADQEKRLGNKIENKKFAFNIILDLALALISGAYINNNSETKENGKINGKSLATALISLQKAKGIAVNFVNAIQGMVDSKEEELIFEKTCSDIQKILKQMEEKVYPLEGASHPFNSIEITNLNGRFFPKKDYQTNKKHYSTTIKIPEFSMKRGDVVLLSGLSGTGKSTFLRLLKRGDINNRKPIKLDNGEMVDSLGNEYVSFRPNINLGDETNVLCQITGKYNISDLTEEEQNKLLILFRELEFNSPELLEELASKKFMEFSTGQQRRLALSKVFYRIDDASSVIIVDEPVGNVENNLIREQLKMIKKYAQSKNVMLILVTHNLDLPEDLATKRYHINNEGILEQIPLKKKEDEIISAEI